MSEPDRPTLFVHLLPSLIPPSALQGSVAIVVDVLRATTVIVQALASGCRMVIPCLEIDEARAIAAGLPEGRSILAGERQGLPIEGFDLGNSPSAFTPEVCLDKTLVITTTNGTRAILASLEAERVFVAAFSNLLAISAHLRELGKNVHVICSGTDGQISLEDAIFAGALASNLAVPRGADGHSWTFGNDEAEIVSRLWGNVPLDDPEDPEPVDFAGVLSLGRGGRRVRALGLSADILEAARIDRFPFVAELLREPLRIVKTVHFIKMSNLVT